MKYKFVSIVSALRKKKKIKLSVEKLFTSVKIITTIGKMTVD